MARRAKQLGDRRGAVRFPSATEERIRVRFERRIPGGAPVITEQHFRLLFPRPLLFDEVAIPAPNPQQNVLPQFTLTGPDDVQAFWFLGRSVDGSAGLRIQNTTITTADAFLPLKLNRQTEVFSPGRDESPDVTGSLEIDRSDDEKQRIDVNSTGLYVVVVGADEASTFPAPFQIHLSGDTSSPQAILGDGAPEGPRATRQDILFNHPAPRWEALRGQETNIAQTTLFKFAKTVVTSPYAKAVLIPPAPDGYTPGEPDPARYLRRAPDPDVPGQLSINVNDPTNPMARTPSLFAPQLGEVIDFTQIPDPASAIESALNAGGPGAALRNTVGAAIGAPNLGLSVALPLDGIASLILDMGSGHEVVDGPGNDLRIHAAGSYTVAVGNSPFAPDFITFSGTASGTANFDLANTGLTSARYVRIIAAPSVQLDAAQALTSQLLTDAALINRSLGEPGLYRVLGRGGRVPESAAFGAFFARLETGGDYEQNAIVVSAESEATTLPQARGSLREGRERDSFIFVATPGDRINIVVNGEGNEPLSDALLELHDPEGILIAANDNFPGRARDAVISVTLPTLGVFGEALPRPAAYRIIVSGVDRRRQDGIALVDAEGLAYPRLAARGFYELKVFRGALDEAGGGNGGGNGQPDIRLSSNRLEFGAAVAGVPTSASVTVSNEGDGVLEVSQIGVTGAGGNSVSVRPETFSLAPGASKEVIVTLTPASSGEVSLTLSIVSNDPDEPSVTLPADVTVSPPPAGEQKTATVTLTGLSLRMC